MSSWHVAGESLHWDSFEQFCVWQLISAESPDCQLVIPALAHLNPEGTHSWTGSIALLSQSLACYNSMCFQMKVQNSICTITYAPPLLIIEHCFLCSPEHPEALSSALLFLKTESYVTVHSCIYPFVMYI